MFGQLSKDDMWMGNDHMKRYSTLLFLGNANWNYRRDNYITIKTANILKDGHTKPTLLRR